MTKGRNVAFGPLEDRAAANADDLPLDRIAVRDYVLEVDIGAFQSERGKTQRVRFNIVVEVGRHAAARDDDVDKVLSYDTITDAIRDQLAAERINLLETLAERLAERVLAHARAMRVYVRIEKLDRIPGTLGVEIMRSRLPVDGAIRKIDAKPAPVAAPPRPIVALLPNDTMYGPCLGAWLDAAEGCAAPVILCVEAAREPMPGARGALVRRRITLLHVEENAWVLAGMDARCVVVASRTELEWACRQGQVSVWAPSKLVLDAVEKPPHVAPADLAIWLAGQFNARATVSLGPAPEGSSFAVLETPAELVNT